MNTMVPSPIAKYIPLWCKWFILLDVHTLQYNNLLFFSRLAVNGFFLFTTTSCLQESEESQQEYMLKLHDLAYLLILLLNEICFYTNKGRFGTIVKLVMEHLTDHEKDAVRATIVRNYHKEVAFYCKLMVICYMGGSLVFYLASALLFSNTLNEGDDKCIHLPMGWVRNSELNFLLVWINAACAFSILSSSLQWFLVMYCMVFKIKAHIRLLCADLNAIDEFIDQAEVNSEEKTSSISRILEDVLLIRIQHASIVSSTNEDIMKTEENITAIVNPYIQKYIKERIIESQVKMYIKSLVEQHIKIIEFSKLTNKAFQLSTLFTVQIGVIVVAFNIPSISLSGQLLEPANMVKTIEVLQLLGYLGLFNYVGQIELDESESLRQTLYNCEWTDKPRSLRHGLLIMQTVATRPLKLTIGGIYTLCMETYTNILNSTYSYASLIHSLHIERD